MDTEEHLQKGFDYKFTLHTACTGYYACNQINEHYVRYHYSPIKCQITGGNKVLTLPVTSVPDTIVLYGYSWSYDPDNNGIDSILMKSTVLCVLIYSI